MWLRSWPYSYILNLQNHLTNKLAKIKSGEQGSAIVLWWQLHRESCAEHFEPWVSWALKHCSRQLCTGDEISLTSYASCLSPTHLPDVLSYTQVCSLPSKAIVIYISLIFPFHWLSYWTVFFLGLLPHKTSSLSERKTLSIPSLSPVPSLEARTMQLMWVQWPSIPVCSPVCHCCPGVINNAPFHSAVSHSGSGITRSL